MNSSTVELTACTVNNKTRYTVVSGEKEKGNDKVSHAHLCSLPLLIAYWVINNYY